LIVDGVKATSDTQYTFTNVTVAHTIRVTFAINTFVITSSAGANGTISPTPSATVNYGASQHFSIAPNSGYHVDSLIVDGTPVTTDTQYTFTNVTAAHTIRAAFAANAFTITSTAGVNGTISPTPSVFVSLGGSQHFSIVPNTGYHVDSLIVDGVKVISDTQYTFTNVTANHTIRVTFAINSYAITSTAGAHGTISPTPSVTVNYGSSQHFSIVPAANYHVDSLIVDGVKVTSDTQYTFTNVTAIHSIRVTFTLNTYTVTTTVVGGGTITPSGTVTVAYGGSQTFKFTANSGYYIEDVLYDGNSQGPLDSLKLTNVTANHTIQVTFTIISYTITASVPGDHGVISPSGAVSVNAGSNQNFAFTPNTGYHVLNVTIDDTAKGKLSSYQFTNVNANHTISVTYGIDSFTVTAVQHSNGTITPSGVSTVTYGGQIIYTIAALTGYHITDVVIDSVSKGVMTVDTFKNVTRNHTIEAFYAVNTLTITSSAGANGTISPTPSATVNYGSSQHFSIVPNTGYHVDSLIVDGAKVTSDTQYTFTNVTATHTIRVTFAINTFVITSSAGANGTISPTPNATVNYGASQHFSIAPNSGYHVDSLIVDGVKVTSDTQYTFSSVTTNHTIRVTFTIYSYTITSSAGTHGTVSPTPSVNLNYGASQHFSIAPNTGYHVDSLIVDGIKVTSDTQYTFNNVTTSHTIRVTFAINTYTVTTTVVGGGTITPSGTVTVAYGGSQTFKFTANSGCYIEDVLYDGNSQGALDSLRLTNVTANHTIQVTFAIISYTITASVPGDHGVITPSGSVNVNAGANQNFTFTPNTGYHVLNVTVDDTAKGKLSSYQFNIVNANHSISVTYGIDSFTVTAVQHSNGTITPSGVSTVTYGGQIIYTIAAVTGYHITDVVIDSVSKGVMTVDTFKNVTRNHTIEAFYAVNTLTITSSAGANGTISPTPSATVNYGSSQHFSIVPNAGYHVDSLIVDGVKVTSDTQYTFTNVTAAHTIRVTFAINTYVITSSAGAHGTISPTPSVTVNYGGSQHFSIALSTGYHVDSLIVDGVKITSDTQYTFTSVTAAHTIRVAFAINTYTVTTSVTGSGTITPSGIVTVSYGGSQTFKFTANSGYYIEDVLYDGNSQGPLDSLRLTNITANHTVSVTFAIISYSITATSGGHGTIAPSGTINVNSGGSQNFTFTPNTGYHILNVTVDDTSKGKLASYLFSNVSANHTINVTFAIDSFTIVAVQHSNGTITPVGTTVVTYGGQQIYTIVPSTGYHISDVVIDSVSKGVIAVDTFKNVTRNHTIEAFYSINTFVITSSAGANGSITPTPSATVNYGSSQHFSIVPNTGYHVDSLIVDGAKITSDTQYTFTNVTATHTIRASFTVNQYTITSSAGSNGAISPTPSVVVTYGANQHFSVKPNANYHVDSLLVDGVPVTVDTQYTFTSVSANHTIRAVFAINKFTITSSAGSNGTISPTPSVSVNYGFNQHFSIVPNTGYHVDSLIVDGIKVTTDTQYTFTNVTTLHTIRVTFAINTYVISSSAGANGSISPTPSVTVNYGASQHFSVMPNTGYYVDSLIVDGVKVTSDTQYTFTGVAAAHTIRATFSINSYTISSSAGANGAISPTPSVSAIYGGSQHFSIVPNAHYHVDSLIIDGVKVASDTQYTFSGISSSHSIRVTFAIDFYAITSSAGTHGAISPAPSVNVDYSTDQHFSIISNTGYHVDSLIVDGMKVTSDTQYTFTNVTAAHTIRVTFAINVYTITSSAGPNGSISPTPEVTVSYGASQHFSIVPNTGYGLDSLIVDGVKVASDTQYTFTNVTASHTIRVTFSIATFTITSATGAHGIITPAPSVTVNYGADQHFSIVPNTGYHVDSLIVDGEKITSDTEYTFTNVTANHSIRVTFAITVYTIASSAGTHGTISPTPSVNVGYGGTQHFSIKPETGYHVDSLFVDDVIVVSDTSYTFTNVAANHTIRVVFTINTYTIAATCGVNGTIYPSGSHTVNYGADQAFTLFPNSGYEVDTLFIDGVAQPGSSLYVFKNVSANHTIYATFALLPSYANKYRTFVYDSLIVAKAIKKKGIAEYWEFNITNITTAPISQVNILFANAVSTIVSADSLVPTGANKTWLLTGLLNPGKSIVLKGKSPVARAQTITKMWLGPVDRTPDGVRMPAAKNIALLPMPNVANVRDDVFGRGLTPAGGLVIGEKKSDSLKYYGWVRLKKSADMYKSLYYQNTKHSGVGNGFTVFNNGAAFIKEQTSLTPKKQNNGTFAELLTLKFNIAMSALGTTPRGFGELQYIEQGSPFYGMLVRDIAKYGDSMMTYAKRFTSSKELYGKLDTAMMHINRAFSAPFDTTSWSDTLKIKALIRVVDTGILTPTSVAPQSILPTMADGENAEVPVTAELYQNYPNPFNPTTTISFDLPNSATVTLKIYNILGQEVKTLIDHQAMADGNQSIDFDASGYASGVYFYSLYVDGQDVEGNSIYYVKTNKMLLVK
jgi:predicted ester cyclase